MSMDETLVRAYLRRIAAERPGSADAAALRALHRAHLLTVPFENLSIHLAEPISLADNDLIDKIVRRRRGGFCYELNGAFALLLEALGFEVRRVAARVYGTGGLGPPFDHLALVVAAAGSSRSWLADVGFGSHSTFPLPFETGPDHDDPAGHFLLADADGGDVDVLRDGEPQYRLERRRRDLKDFVPTCWWQQTSPRSHFTQGLICSLLTTQGRVSLSGRTLITTADGTRSEVELRTDESVLAAYREHFGIDLDRVPRVSVARVTMPTSPC
jgi:N-hydroxyarylamine O-acetyltransferase